MRISIEGERKIAEEIAAEGGTGLLQLDRLVNTPDIPKKVRMFAKATLEAGACVGYHVHHNESETYYILSGEGEYSDGKNTVKVFAGDVTFTPDGEGHAIKNIGREPLVFIALIVLE
ncbi:MAG: cupin domain-containing protein [Clostridia bacterium]|jgi:mannose-6-phosphate isomerase-like protein (cupin superfamily)|nr:cupin domain-containing protein [Clostridia bacterium]